MGDYIQVDISVQSEHQKDLLVAQLETIGFEGFEEEVRLLKAFIPRDQFSEGQLAALTRSLGLNYSVTTIQEKNWNEAWESGFEPVRIGDFCAIRAEFHAPVHGVTHEIIITPKMSFGTGHHATTFLMIEAMRLFDFNGKSVFDFGTGTGILAILAEKLGAASVIAIDTDEWSIENGRENMMTNGCKKIEIYQSDALTSSAFDLILANINKNVILANLHAIKEKTVAGGGIILSGLLVADRDDLLAVAEREGLVVLSEQEKSGWICVQLSVSR